MAATLAKAEPWLGSIGKASWRALAASWLGWMFDGFETYALVLVMTPAVRQLLSPENLPKAPIYIGGLLSVTLLGWAAGGVSAGVLADYVGRRRTLMLSILCYALFAGLTAFCWNYWSLLAFRFFTGLGLGAEWGPGAAIVAESWPPVSRGRAAGAGSIAGFLGLGIMADILGRKPTICFYYLGALALSLCFFLLVRDRLALLLMAAANGFFCDGQFAWMTIYLPELFPTRVRGTAISMVFDSSRSIAGFGPLMAGWLISSLGGIGGAAALISLMYVVGLIVTPFAGPETKGQPLPA